MWKDDSFEYVEFEVFRASGNIVLELRGKGWNIKVRVSYGKLKDEAIGEVAIPKGEVAEARN